MRNGQALTYVCWDTSLKARLQESKITRRTYATRVQLVYGPNWRTSTLYLLHGNGNRTYVDKRHLAAPIIATGLKEAYQLRHVIHRKHR